MNGKPIIITDGLNIDKYLNYDINSLIINNNTNNNNANFITDITATTTTARNHKSLNAMNRLLKSLRDSRIPKEDFVLDGIRYANEAHELKIFQEKILKKNEIINQMKSNNILNANQQQQQQDLNESHKKGGSLYPLAKQHGQSSSINRTNDETSNRYIDEDDPEFFKKMKEKDKKFKQDLKELLKKEENLKQTQKNVPYSKFFDRLLQQNISLKEEFSKPILVSGEAEAKIKFALDMKNSQLRCSPTYSPNHVKEESKIQQESNIPKKVLSIPRTIAKDLSNKAPSCSSNSTIHYLSTIDKTKIYLPTNTNPPTIPPLIIPNKGNSEQILAQAQPMQLQFINQEESNLNKLKLSNKACSYSNNRLDKSPYAENPSNRRKENKKILDSLIKRRGTLPKLNQQLDIKKLDSIKNERDTRHNKHTIYLPRISRSPLNETIQNVIDCNNMSANEIYSHNLLPRDCNLSIISCTHTDLNENNIKLLCPSQSCSLWENLNNTNLNEEIITQDYGLSAMNNSNSGLYRSSLVENIIKDKKSLSVLKNHKDDSVDNAHQSHNEVKRKFVDENSNEDQNKHNSNKDPNILEVNSIQTEKNISENNKFESNIAKSKGFAHHAKPSISIIKEPEEFNREKRLDAEISHENLILSEKNIDPRYLTICRSKTTSPTKPILLPKPKNLPPKANIKSKNTSMPFQSKPPGNKPSKSEISIVHLDQPIENDLNGSIDKGLPLKYPPKKRTPLPNRPKSFSINANLEIKETKPIQKLESNMTINELKQEKSFLRGKHAKNNLSVEEKKYSPNKSHKLRIPMGNFKKAIVQDIPSHNNDHDLARIPSPDSGIKAINPEVNNTISIEPKEKVAQNDDYNDIKISQDTNEKSQESFQEVKSNNDVLPTSELNQNDISNSIHKEYDNESSDLIEIKSGIERNTNSNSITNINQSESMAINHNSNKCSLRSSNINSISQIKSIEEDINDLEIKPKITINPHVMQKKEPRRANTNPIEVISNHNSILDDNNFAKSSIITPDEEISSQAIFERRQEIIISNVLIAQQTNKQSYQLQNQNELTKALNPENISNNIKSNCSIVNTETILIKDIPNPNQASKDIESYLNQTLTEINNKSYNSSKKGNSEDSDSLLHVRTPSLKNINDIGEYKENTTIKNKITPDIHKRPRYELTHYTQSNSIASLKSSDNVITNIDLGLISKELLNIAQSNKHDYNNN